MPVQPPNDPFEKPDIEEVISELREFVATRNESNGGYAPCSNEERRELHYLFEKIMRLKFGPDADGDFPIEWQLVNRNTHSSLNYMPLPRLRDDVDIEKLNTALRMAHVNLTFATREIEIIGYRLNEMVLENRKKSS